MAVRNIAVRVAAAVRIQSWARCFLVAMMVKMHCFDVGEESMQEEEWRWQCLQVGLQPRLWMGAATRWHAWPLAATIRMLHWVYGVVSRIQAAARGLLVRGALRPWLRLVQTPASSVAYLRSIFGGRTYDAQPYDRATGKRAVAAVVLARCGYKERKATSARQKRNRKVRIAAATGSGTGNPGRVWDSGDGLYMVGGDNGMDGVLAGKRIGHNVARFLLRGAAASAHVEGDSEDSDLGDDLDAELVSMIRYFEEHGEYPSGLLRMLGQRELARLDELHTRMAGASDKDHSDTDADNLQGETHSAPYARRDRHALGVTYM